MYIWCFRMFVMQQIPDSNLLMLVVQADCDCSKQFSPITMEPKEVKYILWLTCLFRREGCREWKEVGARTGCTPFFDSTLSDSDVAATLTLLRWRGVHYNYVYLQRPVENSPWLPLHITPRWSATGWGRRRSADGLSPVTPTTLRSALSGYYWRPSHCVVKKINGQLNFVNFISVLQENANDCGGASVISLSASLFLACLSFSPLVSWWWTTLLLQPFSHNDGKDYGSADVFGYWTPEVDLFLKMNTTLNISLTLNLGDAFWNCSAFSLCLDSLCLSFLYSTFWWQNVCPWINFGKYIQLCTLHADASMHTSKALFCLIARRSQPLLHKTLGWLWLSCISQRRIH